MGFQRVLRSVSKEVCDERGIGHQVMWQPGAIFASQHAAEAHLVLKFAQAQLVAIHAKRVTVM